MKLKFSKLQYQQDAVNNIMNALIETYAVGDNDGYSNPRLYFNDGKLFLNIHEIQAKYGLNKISGFEYKREDGLNLDIMMETGTGKTITFIETMYRLNQEYDVSKFIVIVPSNAIRFGTIKNIAITKEYFKWYNKNISVFESGNIYNFIHASNQNINVLITTFQSFNSSKNLIHKNNIEQNLYSNVTSYIDAIKNLRPIIIIDEPHRADGDKTQLALKKFAAPLTLRFGATFKSYKNLINSLDSARAFKDDLVKHITVNAVGTNFNLSLEYLGNRRICYRVDDKQQIKTINKQDNLKDIFNDDSLNGYIVGDLGVAVNPKCIKFSNGFELYPNEPVLCDSLSDIVVKAMVQEAINVHFDKEKLLFAHGIKALCLFFIDKVDSYYSANNKDGELAKLFESLYKKKLIQVLALDDISISYRQYLQQAQLDISLVHDGYFAKSNSDKDNQEQINLILRDKEKLLSFDTPLRFIFSKWALREGWDNPNIFVLIKLSPSNSKITKLQQIGRGLRLAVDSFGNRVTAEHPHFSIINNLEVIIPEVEKNFVKDIQVEVNKNSIFKLSEFTNRDLIAQRICDTERQANKLIDKLEELKIVHVDDNYNCEIICNLDHFNQYKHQVENEALRDFIARSFNNSTKIKDKKRGGVETKIDKDKFEKFRELWSYINSHSTARYELDTNQLVYSIVNNINTNLNIRPIKLLSTITRNAQDISSYESSVIYKSATSLNDKRISFREFITQISLKTKLVQNTIVKILKQIDNDKFISISQNYKQAIQAISDIAISEIHANMIKNIRYNVIETNITNTSLTNMNGEVFDKINAYSLGNELLTVTDLNGVVIDRSLYLDYIGYDSNIEESTIHEANNPNIVVFAKLPKIRIKTPIGEYNPDFAYVLQENNSAKQIFLVVETKGYDTNSDIPQAEQAKIIAGKEFFNAVQAKFPQINIQFKTKINRVNLANIISEVLEDSN